MWSEKIYMRIGKLTVLTGCACWIWRSVLFIQSSVYKQMLVQEAILLGKQA